MAKTTRATQVVQQASLHHTVHSYDYDPDAEAIGLQAARSLAVPPEQVLKTLMTLVDGKPVCVLLASDKEVNMKKLAAAAGGKAAQMMKPADAERATGYVVGGISPFGQKKAVPTIVDSGALAQTLVFVNGGQRGLQIRLSPKDLVAALRAKAAEIAA
jgi:Cys-tRNA(Pro)/Cys-tRNA(Cys) deacylase